MYHRFAKRSFALLALIALVAVPAGAQECGDTVFPLTAGQHTEVGTITVSNDRDNVYVTYDLTYDPNLDGVIDGEFGTLHVWVGTSLDNVPSVANGPNAGTPIPGQFCRADGGACADATGLTSYTFTLSFDQLNIVDVNDACGLPLFVVPHAETRRDGDCECIVASEDGTTCLEESGCGVGGFTQEDTAFGGDVAHDVDSPGRWWFHGVHTVCCDFGEPPALDICETAFGYGSHVWTYGRRSNPDGLPSLELLRNRWGWAVNLTEPGTWSNDIWAGAGLNNTSKGTDVGDFTIDWDGSSVVVTYTLDAGYGLEEIHVYAGDFTPETAAPGQYGYVEEFDPNAPSASVTLDVMDTNGDGIWIIAHSVTCY